MFSLVVTFCWYTRTSVTAARTSDSCYGRAKFCRHSVVTKVLRTAYVYGQQSACKWTRGYSRCPHARLDTLPIYWMIILYFPFNKIFAICVRRLSVHNSQHPRYNIQRGMLQNEIRCNTDLLIISTNKTICLLYSHYIYYIINFLIFN